MALLIFHSLRDYSIKKDDKTLEEHRKDLLSGVESTCTSAKKLNKESDKTDATVHVPVCTKTYPQYHRGWMQELDNWMDQTRFRLPHELSILNHRLFSLQPLNALETFSLYPEYSTFDHVLKKRQRLQSEMEAELKTLDSLIKDTDLTDPVDLRPGSAANELKFLKNVYEPGKDGKVYFKTRYAVNDFSPEDIKVSTDNGSLIVHAKKHEKGTDGSSSSREFYHSIRLPEKVDIENLHANLTKDHVLIIEAPMKEVNYGALKFDENRRICLRPNTDSDKQLDLNIPVLGKNGLVILDDGDEKKKVHLEFPISPKFNAEDITVHIDSNKIVVKGKNEEKMEVDKSGDTRTASVNQFLREFVIPQTIDTCSVSALLKDGLLLLEAPLIKF